MIIRDDLTEFNSKLATPSYVTNLRTKVIIVLFVILIFLFMPWRQTITAPGEVTVYSPTQRIQAVNAMIDSQIKQWHVEEGDFVEEGEVLLELSEIKTEYLAEEILNNLMQQRQAAKEKRVAITSLIKTYENQLVTVDRLNEVVIPNFETKINQKINKSDAVKQKLDAAKQNLETARLNFERKKKLFDSGLIAKRELELAELTFVKSTTELQAVIAELGIANQDIDISRLDVEKASNEIILKTQELESKISKAKEKLAEINSYIFQYDLKISNLESRIQQRVIKAPISGRILRVKYNGLAQTVKAGTELLSIMPATMDQAAELYIPDYFAPLLKLGLPVRIQFSGFPALQIPGFDELSFSSFAAEVVAIDAASVIKRKGNDNYDFRVLVKPRIDDNHEAWPSPEFLRPGTKAVGWILLGRVPIWYEIWRIFNGFAPSIADQPVAKKGKIKIKAK